MSKKIRIDTKQFPIIIITPVDEPNMEDIEIFANEMEEILESKEGKFIIISDNSYNVNLPVNVRVNLGKSLNYISSKFSDRELAVFVVLNSAFGRIMFSCISLVAKNNNLVVVGSFEEAETKAKAILDNSKKTNMKHNSTL